MNASELALILNLSKPDAKASGSVIGHGPCNLLHQIGSPPFSSVLVGLRRVKVASRILSTTAMQGNEGFLMMGES